MLSWELKDVCSIHLVFYFTRMTAATLVEGVWLARKGTRTELFDTMSDKR